MNNYKNKIFNSLICALLLSGCSANNEQKTESDDVFANETVLKTLVNFDDKQQLEWLKPSQIEYAIKADSQGDNQLSLKFSSDARISQLAITPETPWDLRKNENFNLAFDVENKGENSVHLYLSLVNPEGKYQEKSISLAANFSGTVYVPLDGVEADTDTGLWGDMPPWNTADQLMVWRSWRAAQINVDVIASLKFYTIGILEQKQVTIDDIRLRKNPKTPDDWMVGVVDKFGQNAKSINDLTVTSEEQLKQLAEQELAALAKSTGMPHRSRFGGFTNGPRLEATGYFRTAKVKGKWWMVDPDGYLFFSHGPANVRMANLTTITGIDYKDDSIRVVNADEITPEDSMGIIKIPNEIKQDNYEISPLRRNMFNWLPEYDDELAAHYSYRRSTHKGAVPHGETYSFYRANLQRKYGETTPESYVKKWHEVTLDRMKDWGFTSFGNWVDPAFYPAEQVPYFANGWIIGDFKTLSGEKNHWGLMPDPYDPVFTERAEATISAVATKVKSSPWCVGIFIDNEKSWGEREGSVSARYGVILDALSKNSDESPSKKAFSHYLKGKYKSISALNSAWNSQISSWATLDQGVNFTQYTDAHIADLSKMLELLGEQYFKVVHDTLVKYLPNHLYMGARMANWGMPDEIIKASLKYSDVLSFNIYEEGVQAQQWDFLEKVDLPVVIGEFHIGTATDSGLFNPGIVHAANQTDRAEMYKKYMRSVLSKPYMVGAHWFQYVDEPILGRAFDGENANIGFVTVADIPYPEMIDAVKEITSNMYQDRLAPK